LVVASVRLVKDLKVFMNLTMATKKTLKHKGQEFDRIFDLVTEEQADILNELRYSAVQCQKAFEKSDKEKSSLRKQISRLQSI